MTGKSIPVSTTVLMEYVMNNLIKFHEYLEATGEEPEFNPYKQPIVYTLEDGRSIEIPENVKIEAIKVWQKKNLNIDNDGFEDIDESPYDTPKTDKNKNKPQKTEVIVVKEESSNSMLYIVLLIVVLIVAYFVYTKKINS